MAKKIVDEVLNYTVIINGDKGQKELLDLEKSTRKLTEANKDLRAEQIRLKNQNKQGTDEYKKLSAEIKQNNATIKANGTRMAELRNQIGITSLTMAQLTKKAAELKIILRNLVPGSADYKRYSAELSAVNARLRELRLGANQTKTSLSSIADGFNKFQALAVSVIAAITGVVLGIQKLIDYNGKLSDAQADVAKTTGLSAESVDDLTASLGLLKTRTARIELLGLAEEAGRLGKKSKQDILEFVNTANQIKVALGDDLQGDVNENVRLIGKLTEQYSVGTDVGASFGQGMTMIGSAINEVAASGSNQAGYLVDYLSRLVGISSQANISAEAQIGYAAVLDESGQRIETSATATSQAIVGMYKDTETYAGIAGIGVKDFAELLETDANEAFLRFLQGLNGNNEGLKLLTEKFGELGIDGNRAISVLAALAGQTDKIREKQDLANTSLYEATSLQDEYNKKNTNFAAILDRVNKRLGALIIDGSFVAWLKESIKWFAVFIGAIEDSGSSANRWREIIVFTAKALAVFVTGLISYKAAMQLAAFWTNTTLESTLLYRAAQIATTITTNALKGATLIWTAAQALLTGNITRATAAMRLFNTVTKLNPIGLLLSLLAAAAVAYSLYNKELTNAQVTQKILNDVNVEAQKNSVAERENVLKLYAAIQDLNKSQIQREAALKKLIALSPDYLSGINLETAGTLEGAAAIQKYIKSLNDKALAEASYAKRVELNKQLIEEQSKGPEINTWDKVKAWPFADAAESAANRYEKNIDLINEQIKALDNLDVSLQKVNTTQQQTLGGRSIFDAFNADGTAKPQTNKPNFEQNSNNTNSTADASAKEAAVAAKAALAQYEALKQKISELEHEAELERLDANAREIQEVKDKYAQLYIEAKGHKAEMAKLQNLEDEELRLLTLKQQAEAEAERIKKEEDTQKEIQRIREEYGLLTDKERYDEELANLNKALSDKLLSQVEYEKALQTLKKKYARNYVGQTKEEAYNADLLKLQTALDAELITYEQFLITKAELDEKYRNTTQTLTQAEKDKNAAMQAAVQMIGQLSGAVNRLMNIELARNEVVHNAGETEGEFTKRKEEEEGKRMETTKKYAKLNMLLTISQIIADTAAAIIKAPAQLGVYALPFQIAYGILGATQAGIAIAENKKIQGYESGLYPVTDQKGRDFNASRINNAGTGKLMGPTILAGEKPEIIIDPATTRHLEMNYPEVINAIYSSAARVRGYESGHYPTQTTTAPAAAPQTDAELKAMMATIIQTQQQLNATLANGIGAYYDDVQVRKMRERLEINNQVKNARKQ